METRVCPYCKQGIPADALKCHYCREWVNRRHLFRRVLAWAVPLVILWVASMLFMPEVMDRTVLQERRYWEHLDAIKIVSHHVSDDEEGNPCVIGTIKNVSEIPWRSITIQADYFNRAGELVDSDKGSSWEALAPGQERSFKIAFRKKQREAEYDHYRVHIAGAEDASRF